MNFRVHKYSLVGTQGHSFAHGCFCTARADRAEQVNSDLMGPQSLIYTLPGPSCLRMTRKGSLVPGNNCVLDEQLLEDSQLRDKESKKEWKAKGSLQREEGRGGEKRREKVVYKERRGEEGRGEEKRKEKKKNGGGKVHVIPSCTSLYNQTYRLVALM